VQCVLSADKTKILGLAKRNQILYNKNRYFKKGNKTYETKEETCVMPADATATAAANTSSMLIMILIMVAAMYFMIWRPESKRKKQAEAMRNSLKKGDQITTIGGIIGKIVQVTEETIVIETSEDRVRMELTKWAVSTNNSQPPEEKKGKKAKDEDPPQLEDGSDNGSK